MNEQDYMRLVLKRLGGGKSVLGVRELPVFITQQIATIALSSRFLGLRGEVEFEVEVDGQGDLRRVSWERGDGTSTINIRCENTWFGVYQAHDVTSVVEIRGDTVVAVDTETMEAVMFLTGVHPAQL